MLVARKKINAVVSNICCFSVGRQVHKNSFILYSLEMECGLYSLGLGSYSVGLILRLFSFNLWNIWNGVQGGQDALMLQPCNPQ